MLCSATTALSTLCQGRPYLHIEVFDHIEYSYFSSRHEAHKAVTVSRQLALSCAAPLTSAQLDHLFCLSSFSTVLLHVVLGRPTFLFPSGCHSIATMQSSFLSFLSTWPIQFVVLARPTFLFPSGCHSIATMQSSFLSFLSTWPIHSPSDVITDLPYACYFGTCVVSDALRPPNS